MDSKVLFLLGCIPTRLLLALVFYKVDEKYLPYLSSLLFLIGFSFIYLYINNKRLDAPEAGGKTWWKDLRPIHGSLYIMAGLYALKKSRLSSTILLGDAVLGLLFFINHHYN